MPEAPEIRISSDFINYHSTNRLFIKYFDVAKGNNAVQDTSITNFTVSSDFFGKELKLYLSPKLDISVFMGMSGNWKFVPTIEWNNTKYVRLKMDTDDGYSLLLYGGYMGPKYKIGGFKGAKRGPDPIKDFEGFKNNILSNLDKKAFKLPIYEVLLNQEYFNGVGNYLRSSIIYYLDENPFQSGLDVITNRPEIINLCRDSIQKSYELNGGQLKDWANPFGRNSDEFEKWVFYKKGDSIKDSNNRTFWYDPKWNK